GAEQDRQRAGRQTVEEQRQQIAQDERQRHDRGPCQQGHFIARRGQQRRRFARRRREPVFEAGEGLVFGRRIHEQRRRFQPFFALITFVPDAQVFFAVEAEDVVILRLVGIVRPDDLDAERAGVFA